MNMKYYGCENGNIEPVSADMGFISNLNEMYEVLRKCWCDETCPPRMREKWTRENPSLGQCSITAFLVQDYFGGEVYGILRNGGNYHCYNVIGGVVFDLTSEQFGEEKLDYTNAFPQCRKEHFSKAEKRERYELLKRKICEFIK